MRLIQSKTDFIGYRNQFDRVARLLERLFHDYADEYAFQDDVFTFFMHCFHLADWVEHDPVAPSKSKRKVRQALAVSTLFPKCRDIANGSKHLHLNDPKSGKGARYHHVEMTQRHGSMSWNYDVVFDDGTGAPLSALRLALECVNEWRTILKAAGLSTRRLG